LSQFLILYWVLLQSTLSSFSGLSSLPVIRHELVTERHWIDDAQLSAAVTIGRATPGPMGIYIVCIGYFVAGYPGAFAALLALATPALSVLVLLRLLGKQSEHPRVKNAILFVVLAGAAFTSFTLVGMARSALTNWILAALAVLSCFLLLRSKLPTIWILLGAGLAATLIQSI
jgi:chromate transporter